jgi:hypothetical protein
MSDPIRCEQYDEFIRTILKKGRHSADSYTGKFRRVYRIDVKTEKGRHVAGTESEDCRRTYHFGDNHGPDIALFPQRGLRFDSDSEIDQDPKKSLESIMKGLTAAGNDQGLAVVQVKPGIFYFKKKQEDV